MQWYHQQFFVLRTQTRLGRHYTKKSEPNFSLRQSYGRQDRAAADFAAPRSRSPAHCRPFTSHSFSDGWPFRKNCQRTRRNVGSNFLGAPTANFFAWNDSKIRYNSNLMYIPTWILVGIVIVLFCLFVGRFSKASKKKEQKKSNNDWRSQMADHV